METRIITAALPFANNVPHLGNIIGSHLPADIFARYCRLKGDRIIFVGGSDEHGTAIEFAAQQQGKTPKELCDELYVKHKEIYDWFKISYDNFSRTSRPLHHELVIEFFERLRRAGVIIEQVLKIPFCLSCDKGLADRYITGTCPACSYLGANGDQCEKCAKLIDPVELLNPHCSVCTSARIEFRDTKHLFLDLSSLTGQIENWIQSNPGLRTQVKQLTKGWLNQGLKPRCITRDLKWGIPVPLPGYEDKVFYVWFDNVIGYITATVELLGGEAKQLWQDPHVKTYYFLGKDNIPFHTIFWPGQIIADGRFSLPYNVVGLQYLTFEGQKFSKSKKIGIFANQLLETDIPVDYWRFYLASITPETKDADFSCDDFEDRINKELIGNFGNLVNRTLSFIWRKFNGELPNLKTRNESLESEIKAIIKSITGYYEACEIRKALAEILRLSDLGNQYFSDKKPWETNDSDVLVYAYEICRLVTLLLSPIVVDAKDEIFKCLNTSNSQLELDFGGKKICEPKIIFAKLENTKEKLGL